MSAVERYLARATRGLWGEKKRDAVAELRGAVEDKMYRHRLLGLSEQEAEQAALRDLGSPAAIARELGRVHTGPVVMRAALLLGVTGMLGIQAVAQETTVKSAYLTVDTVQMCRLVAAAERALLSSGARARFDRFVAAQDGTGERFDTCRASAKVDVSTPPVLLRTADLTAALRAAGIRIDDQWYSSRTSLFVHGGSDSAQEIPGGRYVDSGMVIPLIRGVTRLPLRLEGLRNPTLHIGQTALRLGTPNAPVSTTDLLAAALLDERRTNALLPKHTQFVPEPLSRDPAALRLAVTGKDGTLYVTVHNGLRISGGGYEVLQVRSLAGGRLEMTESAVGRPQIVTSLKALDAATARKRGAVLVYRLDASDLRNLKLTPVPASQLQMVTAP